MNKRERFGLRIVDIEKLGKVAEYIGVGPSPKAMKMYLEKNGERHRLNENQIFVITDTHDEERVLEKAKQDLNWVEHQDDEI